MNLRLQKIKVVGKDFRKKYFWEIFPISGKNWKDLSDFYWKEKEWKVSKKFWKELLKLSDYENSHSKSIKAIEFLGKTYKYAMLAFFKILRRNLLY